MKHHDSFALLEHTDLLLFCTLNLQTVVSSKQQFLKQEGQRGEGKHRHPDDAGINYLQELGTSKIKIEAFNR